MTTNIFPHHDDVPVLALEIGDEIWAPVRNVGDVRAFVYWSRHVRDIGRVVVVTDRGTVDFREDELIHVIRQVGDTFGCPDCAGATRGKKRSCKRCGRTGRLKKVAFCKIRHKNISPSEWAAMPFVGIWRPDFLETRQCGCGGSLSIQTRVPFVLSVITNLRDFTAKQKQKREQQHAATDQGWVREDFRVVDAG
jgi:hypothetical protein